MVIGHGRESEFVAVHRSAWESSISHPSWNRTRRRQLPALLRNLLVALFGCLVAVLAFSALRAMNF